uniref:Lipocalin-2 1 n=1 Tax=Amblyomma triste TaxID=251400 RepID=A0A023G497_AMBTT
MRSLSSLIFLALVILDDVIRCENMLQLYKKVLNSHNPYVLQTRSYDGKSFEAKNCSYIFKPQERTTGTTDGMQSLFQCYKADDGGRACNPLEAKLTGSKGKKKPEVTIRNMGETGTQGRSYTIQHFNESEDCFLMTFQPCEGHLECELHVFNTKTAIRTPSCDAAYNEHCEGRTHQTFKPDCSDMFPQEANSQ